MSDNGTTGPAAGRGRTGRWVTWLLVIAVAALLIVAAIGSGRIIIAVAAAAGLAVAWLLTRWWRLVRRRPLVGWLLTLLVLCGGLGGLGLLVTSGQPRNSPGAIYTGTITVPYQATAQVDGDHLVLHERVFIDDKAIGDIESIMTELAREPVQVDRSTLAVAGWDEGIAVDGAPTFERTSTVEPDQSSLISSTVTIPIDLGRLSLVANGDEKQISLDPRTQSRLEIDGAKGAIGSTYPIASATANDPRRADAEVATIDLDPYTVDVTVALLSGPLRNPAGQAIYEAVVWGPLPWVIGGVITLITSLLGDKLKQLLGLAARRAVRAGRKASGGNGTGGSLAQQA